MVHQRVEKGLARRAHTSPDGANRLAYTLVLVSVARPLMVSPPPPSPFAPFVHKAHVQFVGSRWMVTPRMFERRAHPVEVKVRRVLIYVATFQLGHATRPDDVAKIKTSHPSNLATLDVKAATLRTTRAKQQVIIQSRHTSSTRSIHGFESAPSARCSHVCCNHPA